MNHDTEARLMLKGIISELSPEQQKAVTETTAAIRKL